MSLKRNDKDGVLMDDLQYVYENITNGYAKNTNKLRHVMDAVGFKGFDDVHAQIQDNYQYTETGEIELDKEKQIKITYHVNGKVEVVKDEQTNRIKVTYTYNERAERMTKNHYQYDNATNQNVLVKTTYYVREVSGAVISIYEKDHPLNTPISQEEVLIAGIGVYYAQTNQFVYQLTDHLGNVRATIKDTKLNGEAEVLSYADYYPFGMTMAGRHGASSPQYRLAYQGQELDTEMGGSGFYAFELRNYDPRLGKWLSPDPYQQHWSPYLAMSNNPVSFIDPDGGFDTRTYEWYNGSGAAGHAQWAADRWNERMAAWETMTYLVDDIEVSSSEFAHTVESGNFENLTVAGNMYAGKSYEDLPFLEGAFKVTGGDCNCVMIEGGYVFNRSGLPGGDRDEPILPNIVSLTNLINKLNQINVKSSYDLVSYYGGRILPGPYNDAPNKGILKERYVYSISWGWIDMKHFANTGYIADRYLIRNKRSLKEGEDVERRQQTQLDLINNGNSGIPGMATSAWSYEDLVSNALGIYFAQEYWENYDGTFTQALNAFFTDIGVVNNPLQVAPNINDILPTPGIPILDANGSPVLNANGSPSLRMKQPIQNFTYVPMYNTHRRERGVNKKIVDFIEKLTGKDINDDRRVP